MACFHPITIPVKTTFTGFPIWSERTLPCGTCLGCRATQAREWAIRNNHERQLWQYSWYLTLTYREEDLPQHGSLYPTDLSEFFKALRRKYPPEALRYFGCGEYGEETQRPHYHALLFGPELLDRDLWTMRSTGPVWRSETLEDAWNFGHVEFSNVTEHSISYVSGYIRKKISKTKEPDAYTRVNPHTGELVEIEPEFTRCSLRPAIANRWIEKWWKEVYPRDYVLFGGKKFKPPRYYDKWMAQDHPDAEHDCKEHQLVLGEVKMRRDAASVFLDEAKLASKEKIHKARQKLYQKAGTL